MARHGPVSLGVVWPFFLREVGGGKILQVGIFLGFNHPFSGISTSFLDRLWSGMVWSGKVRRGVAGCGVAR